MTAAQCRSMAKRQARADSARLNKARKRLHLAPVLDGAAASPTSPGSDHIFVAAGSYERILYGLKCHIVPSAEGIRLDIEPLFQFAAHLSCIRTVSFSPISSSSKVLLVSGATDETTKVWDAIKLKEVGSLAYHSDVVTRVSFASTKHCLSASQDGTLALFETKDWTLLRSFQGHKAGINDVAIHPMGRVALSVSADRTLRMWDLFGSKNPSAMPNRSASSTRLGAEGKVVRWNQRGDLFAIILNDELRVFTSKFALLRAQRFEGRLHDVAFVKRHEQDLILLATEKDDILAYDVADWQETSTQDLTPIARLVGHRRRVKALQVVSLPNQDLIIVVSVSSDGYIRFFNLTALKKTPQSGEISEMAAYNTNGSRLVCLSAMATP